MWLILPCYFNQSIITEERKITGRTLPWTKAKFLNWILANEIKQYKKYLIYQNKVGFIPETQVWFYSKN